MSFGLYSVISKFVRVQVTKYLHFLVVSMKGCALWYMKRIFHRSCVASVVCQMHNILMKCTCVERRKYQVASDEARRHFLLLFYVFNRKNTKIALLFSIFYSQISGPISIYYIIYRYILV